MQTTKAELKIRGMVCRACTDTVEAALMHSRGVISAKAAYLRGTCTVEYDPAVTDEAELVRCIESAGYETGEKSGTEYLVDIICVALTAAFVWALMNLKLNAVPEVYEGASLGYIFLVGLLTGTHCIAMCGGIALSQSGGGSAFVSSAMYNGGRTASYTVMGAVFGALGTVISYTMQVKSLVFTMVGLLVALIGINMWGLLPGLRALVPQQSSFCSVTAAGRRRFAARPLIVGLLTGVMPCGSMYAMWLLAMSSGSAASGALIMLAFVLGTVPLMLLFGYLGSLLPRKGLKYMLKLGAVLVTAFGIKMLIGGLKMAGVI